MPVSWTVESSWPVSGGPVSVGPVSFGDDESVVVITSNRLLSTTTIESIMLASGGLLSPQSLQWKLPPQPSGNVPHWLAWQVIGLQHMPGTPTHVWSGEHTPQ
jgi:hypothetical protein